MQDPTSLTTFPQFQTPQFPEQEHLRCPRCDSDNTKFCYYNNYNLSQPRHYCKSCRRYWTKGGSLRNIPVGGGTRKSMKRSSSSSKRSSSASSLAQTQVSSPGLSPGSGRNSGSETKPGSMLAPEVGTGLGFALPSGGGVGVGSFTSLLGMASQGQFGNFTIEGLSSNGLKLGQSDGSGRDLGLELLEGNSGATSEGLMISRLQNGGDPDQSCWSDLAVFTQPGSDKFH